MANWRDVCESFVFIVTGFLFVMCRCGALEGLVVSCVVVQLARPPVKKK